MGTLIIPDATIYDFGILTSNVHMSWMRAVAGILKSDYRYSVYASCALSQRSIQH